MNDDPWRPRKVVIVGAGAVGSTFAYTLAQSGLADEITLRDANHELAMGQVLDLAHGQAFFPSVQIREAQVADYADARMIVITAGAKQRPGESRLDLLQRNVKIIHDIVDEIVMPEVTRRRFDCEQSGGHPDVCRPQTVRLAARTHHRVGHRAG